MWGMFGLAVCVETLLLYLPGYLLLRAARLARLSAAACAPLLTIALHSLICATFGFAGITCTWTTTFAPLVLLGAACFAFARFKSAKSGAGERDTVRPAPPEGMSPGAFDAACAALYIVVALAVCCGMLFITLGTPEAFIQAWDNVHHIDAVRAFADSGRWSSVGTTLYLGADADIDPFVEGSFYPSAWHALGAALVSALGVSSACAMNAVNTVAVVLVLPLGTFALLRTVFEDSWRAVVAGAFVVVASASFPWELFTWGPLYPNILAYCLVPAFMHAFIVLIGPASDRAMRIVAGAVLLAGALAFAFVQPNGLFTAGALLMPYVVYRVFTGLAHSKKAASLPKETARRRALAGALLCALGLVGLWVVAFSMPFMSSVVWYRWPPDTDLLTVLRDVVTMRFRIPGVQIGCTLLLAVGIGTTFVRRRHLWLTASFILSAVLYAGCVCADGVLHQLLAGFWYTDSPRVAAIGALAAVPLEALGLAGIIGAVHRVLAGRSIGIARAAAAAALCAACALLYFPYDLSHGPIGLLTPGENCLRAQARHIANEYGMDGIRVYDEQERQFVREALASIPEGSLVVNQPHDGSAYSYGADGLRTYYRYWRGYGNPDEEEKRESELIRMRLDKLATDPAVQEAVRTTGVEYVLQLDRGITDWEHRFWLYDDGSLWRGVDGITETTPGFDVVLSRDDMCLYKISLQ